MSDNDSTVPAYPLVTYGNSIGVAAAVSAVGGAKSQVQKALIAKELKCSDTSGGFLQRLASARSFGMIDGRGSFRLTENGTRYFFPSSESDKSKAMLAFFSSPPIFRKLIEKLDGTRLPSNDNIANLVHVEMNVSDSWKDRVASYFVKTAEAVSVIDGERFLRYRASVQSVDSSPRPPSTPNTPPDEPKNENNGAGNLTSTNVQPGNTAWVYSLEGHTVRIETSSGELPRVLWDKLNTYVKVLEPTK